MTEDINPEGLPVLPDSIARKLDKGQDVALEEVREAAIDNLKAGRRNPVRAENLRPISRATAAGMTSQKGETLPRMPATRRVIPAPFRRPRIDIDHHGKCWQTCRADDVHEGDIVPGVGEVELVALKTRKVPRSELVGSEFPSLDEEMIGVGVDVVLFGGEDNALIVDAQDTVQVFRAEPEHV